VRPRTSETRFTSNAAPEPKFSVYQHLGSRLKMQTRETELTGLLALIGATLVLAAASLSLLWFGRIS
jgi:hypothetical protein